MRLHDQSHHYIALPVTVDKYSVFARSLLHYLGGTLELPIYHDNLLDPSKRPPMTTRASLKTQNNVITGTDNLYLIAHTLTRIAHERTHTVVYHVKDSVLPEVRKGFIAALNGALR